MPRVPSTCSSRSRALKFEELADGLIQRRRGPVRQALKDAKLSPSDIDEVVLVGGSTRVPKVQQLVARFLARNRTKVSTRTKW